MESGWMTVLLVVLVAPVSGEVNVTRMEDDLRQHFSQARHHLTNPDYKRQALVFIRDQFRDMGLEVHLDHFPTALDNVTGVNVIGMLKGRHYNTAQDSIAAIGAHYDTMRNTPGVDDNGAAVVVMMEAARQLSHNASREHTLLFIAFDFEEWEPSVQSLVACESVSCGGRAFVTHWLPNFFPDPIPWKGIFNMDTIMNFNHTAASQDMPYGLDILFPEQVEDIQSDGGRGDFLMVAGRREDQSLMDAFQSVWSNSSQAKYEVEMFTIPDTSNLYSHFLRSDHASFWEHNLSAIFITDTADFRGFMDDCYHRECDALENVTPAMLQFAAKTCRTLVSVLGHLSPQSAATPTTPTPCTSATSVPPAWHLGTTMALGSVVMSSVLRML